MRAIAQIALSIPHADKPDRYFLLRLKQELLTEPAQYNSPSRLLAVSDIEGNFQRFCSLLMRNRVIDKYFDWTFEDGHLVIVGDCFDRGEQVTECLWLIYMLEEKAKKSGGKVHYILGNHEIMNMNGDWRYIHPKYATQTRLKKPHTALYDGNSELWRWLRTKNIIEKIGDVLFVHGGISPELLKYNYSVEEINALARPWYTKTNELPANPFIQILFQSDYSPFWYRGYYQKAVSEEQVEAVLNHFDVKLIVTGHTVVNCIAPFYNGKIINIDTDHASECSEALLIRKEKFYRINNKGEKEKIQL